MAMPLPVPSFTTDDLRKFPKDAQRYELLEGMLLVTPAPGSAHQGVLSRLHFALSTYLAPLDLAWVASPGEIEIAPKTLLDPDLLVVPAAYPPGTSWRSMRGWWLAVEIFSPSSKIYDRDFKRDAYLSLGVGEVWLVDLDERALFVSQGSDRDVKHARGVVWHPSQMPAPFEIELATVFRGIV